MATVIEKAAKLIAHPPKTSSEWEEQLSQISQEWEAKLGNQRVWLDKSLPELYELANRFKSVAATSQNPEAKAYAETWLEEARCFFIF